MKRLNTLTEFARVINSDRYQYTESDIFLMEKMQDKIATFDVFFRKTEDGGFAVVAGVQEVLDLIHILNETSEEEKRMYFSTILEEQHLIEFLSKIRFTGDIYALPDGSIAYPNEPILTIKAPLIEAQILETPILNIINMAMAIATKASMVTRAAYPQAVSSFGSRRAHGFDSAVSGNKAAVIGGCSGHSNLMTEYRYGVPSSGTMAHSYIQSFGVGKKAEKEAFTKFIEHRKNRKGNTLLLLIDTYNTIKIGLENAIEAFQEAGIDDNYPGVYGVRIDSGDLAYLSKKCRQRLDEVGMKKAKIFLTNSLDEKLIKSLKEQGACVDIYGVGDAIAVSKSYPCFGGVYKIVELDGKPLIKLSEDVIKISNPGFKEVYRIFDKEGKAYADLVTLVEGDRDKEILLSGKDLILRDEKYDFKKSYLKAGEYTFEKLTKVYVKQGEVQEALYEELLDTMKSQKHYFESLEKVSDERKRLENPHQYKVDLSQDLLQLKYGLIKSIKEEA
ncbi:nicotinate phosphoribosyltransferase [Fusobacterium equinum]|uniref:Nicotinate phosphoribosyltransferase n=1 Tax=Fusobacterium equinum TaxID=134605 RepID=A0A133NAY8_9FUSO|nr:nicotinate phosphoribosyltransferase [Fusobacterium equinum]KXA13440.1 nicotinate phosphoribosyltransferase [Fusobacterium equinum]